MSKLSTPLVRACSEGTQLQHAWFEAVTVTPCTDDCASYRCNIQNTDKLHNIFWKFFCAFEILSLISVNTGEIKKCLKHCFMVTSLGTRHFNTCLIKLSVLYDTLQCAISLDGRLGHSLLRELADHSQLILHIVNRHCNKGPVLFIVYSFVYAVC